MSQSSDRAYQQKCDSFSSSFTSFSTLLASSPAILFRTELGTITEALYYSLKKTVMLFLFQTFGSNPRLSTIRASNARLLFSCQLFFFFFHRCLRSIGKTFQVAAHAKHISLLSWVYIISTASLQYF